MTGTILIIMLRNSCTAETSKHPCKISRTVFMEGFGFTATQQTLRLGPDLDPHLPYFLSCSSPIALSVSLPVTRLGPLELVRVPNQLAGQQLRVQLFVGYHTVPTSRPPAGHSRVGDWLINGFANTTRCKHASAGAVCEGTGVMVIGKLSFASSVTSLSSESSVLSVQDSSLNFVCFVLFRPARERVGDGREGSRAVGLSCLTLIIGRFPRDYREIVPLP